MNLTKYQRQPMDIMDKHNQAGSHKRSDKSKSSNRRKSELDLGSMVYGKIPPQARDLEEAVLGAIMLEKTAFDEIADMISDSVFYVEAHQRIYRAMIELARRSQPIDILTVNEQLRSTGDLEVVGGPYYVSQLTNKVVGSAHIQSHIRIILQKFIQREVIRIAGQLIGDAYEDSTDAFDLMDQAETEIFSIRQTSIKKQFKTMDVILVEVIQELEANRHLDRHLTGITSGFDELDYVTCGWQPEDLIILAARPSVGKTAFALKLARNAAEKSGKSVGFFSLEMKDKKLIQRLLASESRIWLWKIMNARMEESDMKKLYADGVKPLSQMPILVDETNGLNIQEFRTKARRMVHKHNVGIIFVDYMQLMTAPAHIINREQQVSYISKQLKEAAKELGIPIVALSQLSREIEKGKGREPQLSDLRESGSIEQDSDLVMFLWQPDLAEITANLELTDCVYTAIKKHRNGAHAKFVGKFKKEIQKWEWLQVVDGSTLKPVGEAWKPVTVQGQVIDFTIPKKEQVETGDRIDKELDDDDQEPPAPF